MTPLSRIILHVMRKEPLSTERPWQTVIRVGVCLLCMHPSAMDAQDSLLLRDYDYVKSSAVWTTSQNAAALTTVTSANISRVEVTADYRKGSLADYSDGTSEMEAGAVVGSLYRVGRRTVMMGEMRYRYFSGKEMGTSCRLRSHCALTCKQRSSSLCELASLAFIVKYHI